MSRVCYMSTGRACVEHAAVPGSSLPLAQSQKSSFTRSQGMLGSSRPPQAKVPAVTNLTLVVYIKRLNPGVEIWVRIASKIKAMLAESMALLGGGQTTYIARVHSALYESPHVLLPPLSYLTTQTKSEGSTSSVRLPQPTLFTGNMEFCKPNHTAEAAVLRAEHAASQHLTCVDLWGRRRNRRAQAHPGGGSGALRGKHAAHAQETLWG